MKRPYLQVKFSTFCLKVEMHPLLQRRKESVACFNAKNMFHKHIPNNIVGQLNFYTAVQPCVTLAPDQSPSEDPTQNGWKPLADSPVC